MAPGYSVVYVLALCGSAVSPSHDLVPDPALTDKRLVFILNAPETPRQKERERERDGQSRESHSKISIISSSWVWSLEGPFLETRVCL